MRPPRRPHHDLHTLVQRDQRLHQPLQRDVLQPVAPHLRDLGLGHAGEVGGLDLGQATLIDEVIQLHRQQRLGREVLGIVKAEISQHVVGALGPVLAWHYLLLLA